MKTIFIVAGGLSDLPGESDGGTTPLMEASSPSLDGLAKCGCCGMTKVIDESVPLTPENVVLSLMGYDFSRGTVPVETLEKLGSGRPFRSGDVRLFVVPKFSGHGVVVTDYDSVRGAAMMSMLKPLYPLGTSDGNPSENPCGSLYDKAMLAIKAIEMFDFVLIYVDDPYRKALEGDASGKAEAIERIDRDLISPVADYVWNAKLQMNLVVTGGFISSCRQRKAVYGDVPTAVYFNDDLPYDMQAFDEKTVADGPLDAPMPGDLIRMLVAFEPLPENEN